MRLLRVSVLIFGLSVLLVSVAPAQILFEDDFESGKVDKDKWVGAASWKIVENEEGIPALGESVLDTLGGEEGLGAVDFPSDYDYYADFRLMSGLTGFVFHGQDINNIYMHQMSTNGASYTPNNTRWHRKVGGTYTAEPEPYQDGEAREMQTWYRVKFEVRGATFKSYLGDVGAEYDQLTLVGEWTDSQKSFTEGKIGFRQSGTEYAQYDNVMVVTAGYNFAVEPGGKLAVSWGGIKEDL